MNKFHFFSRMLFICFFVSACTLRFVSEVNIRIKVDSMEESKQVGESIINELGKANIRQKLLTSFAREQIAMIKDLELNNVTETTLLSGGPKKIETVVTITIYYTDKNFNPEPILNFLRQLMINSYKNYRDNIFRKKIIGSWADSNYYPRFGIVSFEEAGVYKAWLYESEKKEKLLFFIEGIWWIDNGYLYNKLSKSTFPLIKSEDVARDMIVNISEDTLTLIDEDNKQYTRTKIR